MLSLPKFSLPTICHSRLSYVSVLDEMRLSVDGLYFAEHKRRNIYLLISMSERDRQRKRACNNNNQRPDFEGDTFLKETPGKVKNIWKCIVLRGEKSRKQEDVERSLPNVCLLNIQPQ